MFMTAFAIVVGWLLLLVPFLALIYAHGEREKELEQEREQALEGTEPTEVVR